VLVRKARGAVAVAVAAATASTPFAELVLEVRLVDLEVAGGKTAPVRDERRPGATVGEASVLAHGAERTKPASWTSCAPQRRRVCAHRCRGRPHLLAEGSRLGEFVGR